MHVTPFKTDRALEQEAKIVDGLWCYFGLEMSFVSAVVVFVMVLIWSLVVFGC